MLIRAGQDRVVGGAVRETVPRQVSGCPVETVPSKTVPSKIAPSKTVPSKIVPFRLAGRR
jgi:hypothetical protein